MANGVTIPNPTAGHTPREVLPPTFTAVDERRFESEIRRIDTTLADERKNREKFETRIEKAVNDLRGDMNAQFNKMEKNVDARFDRMEKSVDAQFDKMEKSVDTRFDKMEKSVDARFDRMEKNVDARFDKMERSVDARFEKVDVKFDQLNDKMDSHFRWMLSFLVGAVLIPIALQYFTK
jgi:DNA anti-recombination protein RmuC